MLIVRLNPGSCRRLLGSVALHCGLSRRDMGRRLSEVIVSAVQCGELAEHCTHTMFVIFENSNFQQRVSAAHAGRSSGGPWSI